MEIISDLSTHKWCCDIRRKLQITSIDSYHERKHGLKVCNVNVHLHYYWKKKECGAASPFFIHWRNQYSF